MMTGAWRCINTCETRCPELALFSRARDRRPRIHATSRPAARCEPGRRPRGSVVSLPPRTPGRRTGEPIVDAAAAQASGKGAAKLLETFDRINRDLAAAPALRQFLERERDGLRIITSSAGVAQPRMVGKITSLIEDEVRAGTFASPVEPAILGYAIVRLAEAFLFNDAMHGIRGDVDRLREIEALILGVELP